MNTTAPQCKYCSGIVYFEPGFTSCSDGTFAHQECWERSGNDNGAIKRLYNDKQAQEDYIEYFLGL